MKVQKIKFIAFVAMMLMFIGSSVLKAQRPDGPPRGQQERPAIHQQDGEREKGPKGPRIPGLTEEQKEQMKAIHLKAEKAALPLKNQVGEKEARLRTLTTSEEYNETAVNTVIDEIGGLKSDLMKLRVATGQEIKSILTDEQKVFFDNHIGKGKGPQGKDHRPQRGKRG